MQISILSNKDRLEKRHQLLIDYDDGSVGFIVLYNEEQIDFVISKEEYQQMRSFIDYAIDQEVENNNKHKKDEKQ